MLNIPVLLGTGHEGSKSHHAAEFVRDQLIAAGVSSELHRAGELSPGVTYGPKQWHPKVELWRNIMAKADGLVIVSPEYNHGYPGELKLVLDCAFEEYRHKPVAICGTSIGVFGGSRMVEQLRQVVIEFSMVPLQHAMYFSKVQDAFDDLAKPTSPDMEKRFEPLCKELLWYAEVLKAPREAKRSA